MNPITIKPMFIEVSRNEDAADGRVLSINLSAPGDLIHSLTIPITEAEARALYEKLFSQLAQLGTIGKGVKS